MVAHETSSGTMTTVGNYFAYGEAAEAARAYSQASGARFAE